MREPLIKYKEQLLKPVAIVFRRGGKKGDRYLAMVHTPGERYHPVTIETMLRIDKIKPEIIYESPKYMTIMSHDMEYNYSWYQIRKEDILINNDSNQDAFKYLKQEEVI